VFVPRPLREGTMAADGPMDGKMRDVAMQVMHAYTPMPLSRASRTYGCCKNTSRNGARRQDLRLHYFPRA
jgi:hypothetical protein